MGARSAHARAPTSASASATARARRPRGRGGVVATRATTVNETATARDLPKVLVAGGGIAGLITAHACRRKGMEVTVFEKVRKYEPFGGPIQLQCNAQGALDSIDPDVAEAVMRAGTITGDRVNGLLDGVSGEWFYRFDTRKPCHENGLPLTLVLSRFELLDILSKGVGAENIEMGTVVEKYEHRGDKIVATLTDGTEHEGDVLIGADGIHSRLRKQMRGAETKLAYAGYAVYTAICDYSQPHREPVNTDPNKVGYQVFLGPKQYFVSSDVGNGQQQYYAFLEVPPGGDDEFAKCERWANYRDMLLDRFSDWCPAVLERLECTKPEDVERRDVNDLLPDPRWVDGRMALLGDSAHAVQPNLGQGGGQAIEGAYVLADELSKCEGGKGVQKALMMYAARRFLRTGAIHGLSRFSSLMNTFYRRYLGDEPYGWYPEPAKEMWHEVSKAKIPHPGSVVGQIALMATMPIILEYVGAGYGIPGVLGGASTGNGKDRVPKSQVPGISAPKRDLTADDFKMKGIPGLAK
ncbi:Monooxygenase, FAD-binding [Ostreococcus tauri]|uniref:Monooxygenase, FAD-binding n=1 Tax=Ostreococcus tauri TaxID=70448 RepID=A0A096P7X8_OSTTA|nr:Monooxygenase, FAD-binding [Ostreococcus tauri]CEG00292.1 Monooxygenase, FAD-binding [Ostreococcus tauri]|eukprot:XP_003083516.2 Monooxygenase, FAD-binding [Ostreococcus tauri]